MSRGKGHKHKGRGPGHAVGAPDTGELVRSLRVCAAEIAAAGATGAGPLWGAAHKLLLKTRHDRAELGRLVMARDLEALNRMVETLAAGGEPRDAAAAGSDGPGGPEPDEPAAPAPPAPGVPPEELKKALRAFKKRLKLLRLDDESRLSVSPMTSGKSSEIRAIMPPREFPEAVWEALAAEGRLRRAGPGFYELGEG